MKKLILVFSVIILISGCTKNNNSNSKNIEIINEIALMGKDIEEVKSMYEALKSKPYNNLLNEEKYNAALLGYYIELHNSITIKTPETEHSDYSLYQYNQTVEIDLNGDGRQDNILVSPTNTGFTVIINNSEWSTEDIAYLGNLADGFAIIDINKNDNYKEIVISDHGLSNDDISVFLCYDGEKIIYMNEGASTHRPDWSNEIGGAYSYIKFTGNGEITTLQRAQLLQTWWYPIRYELTARHLLRVVQEIYNVGWKVFVLKDFPLYTERNMASPIITVDKGSIITLTALDDIEWVQVTMSDGRSGWLNVIPFDWITIGDDTFMAREVLFLLSYAD